VFNVGLLLSALHSFIVRTFNDLQWVIGIETHPVEHLHDYLVSPSVMSIFQDADFAGEPGELDAREDPALDNGDDDDQEDGEEECDGENDDEIEPVENGPESFPDTEIDGEASEVDGDDEVEMSDLDPYRNQPNNQLGLDDYQSPRSVSEEHAPTPAHDEREVAEATPALRKAVHLKPEDLPSSSSSKSSPGANETVELFLITSNITDI
jgi:hypothetical protein